MVISHNPLHRTLVHRAIGRCRCEIGLLRCLHGAVDDRGNQRLAERDRVALEYPAAALAARGRSAAGVQ